MIAIASPATSALPRFLVSPSALPPEGADFPASHPAVPGEQRLSRSLCLVQSLARPEASIFTLRGTSLSWPAAPGSDLSLIELTNAEEDGVPGVEASGASSLMDWGAVATAFARRTDPGHFLGTHDDAVRILLDEIRTAARHAAQHFTGDALPLVEIRRSGPDGATLAFLGIWLAHPEDAISLHGALPSGQWNDDTFPAQGTLLVLDGIAEVEGHGLREVVLSVSMMAIVFSGPAEAGLLDAFSPSPVAVTHESQAKTDGTPLAVKSQKLVQDGPKIYPSGLAGQSKDASRRVVVDVKAQRAYLFVDGRLAFETPVSTASKGRTTPRGTFTITEKIRTGKHSTIYRSAMPYWNRLDQSAIGMHTGQLPGYPASHGCIRLPDESARFIFDNAPKGTTVQVVDALAAAPQPTPAGLMASNP